MLKISIQYQLESAQIDTLATGFTALCNSLSQEIDANQLFENITLHYSEEQRAYHNLSHIHSMLQLTKKFSEQIEQADMLQLAIWYHDIIYNPSRKDNELKSAEYAQSALSNHLEQGMLDVLQALINSTAKHQPLVPHPVNDWLLDFDLAVLATDRQTYTEYKAAIRHEYRIYPGFLYRPGRKKILHHFLEREHIYYTELFQTHYEKIARSNLNWELSTL